MEEIAAVYLNEGKTKHLIDTSTSSKCGEVFRSTTGKYSLCCGHCNLSFLCLAEFSEHIEEHFQLISIASEPNATLEGDSVKDRILKTMDIKEEPQLNISEIKIEINESHLMKKRARKKVKGAEGLNESLTKTTKLKVNKSTKVLKEPMNNIWICDICGK